MATTLKASLWAIALLAASTMAWEVDVYFNDSSCQPGATDSTTYRIFTSTAPTYNACINTYDPFTNGNGIECAEYRNGGADGPFDCSDQLTYGDPTLGKNFLSYEFYPGTKLSDGYTDIAGFSPYAGEGCANGPGNGDHTGSLNSECLSYSPSYATSFEITKDASQAPSN